MGKEMEIFREDEAVVRYLLAIGEARRLLPEEEAKLARQAAGGDEKAAEALTESNLRLVYHLARRYRGRGLCMMDLIQEGNEALQTAAATYRTEWNLPFSVYVRRRIRIALSAAVRRCAETNLPSEEILEAIRKIREKRISRRRKFLENL